MLRKELSKVQICSEGRHFLFGGPALYCLVSLSFCPGKAEINKTKWPRQVRELVLDSDSDILDF